MQKREIWKVLVLGFITLGLYGIYWFYKTRKEIVARGGSVPPIKVILLPVLAIFLVALLQLATQITLNNAGSADSTTASKLLNILSALIGSLAVIAIIPVFIWWYYKYSRAAARVTANRISFDMGFWLGLVLHIAGFGIVVPALFQDAYNKTGDSAAPADSGPVPADPPYPHIGQTPPTV